MKRLLKYMRRYTVAAVVAPLFKLLEALLELSVPIVVAKIIDQGIETGDHSYVIYMCLVLLAMGAVGLAFSLTAQYFSAKVACNVAADVRSDLFSKIQGFSFAQLDRVGTSTLITRMTGDVNQVQTGVNLTLRLLLRSPFVVFGAMIMAFIVGAKAGSATMSFAIVIPVLFVVTFIILLAGIPMYSKVQGKLDNVTGKVRSNLEGARVLRAFRLEENETEKFSTSINVLKRFQLAAGRISALLNPLTFVIVNLAIILLLKNGAVEVDSGNLTQGELVALYNYMTQILVELVKMANLIITITKAIACAKRISTVMDEKTDMKVEAVGSENESADAPAVAFRNVSFGYPNASGTVLKNINLEVARGETLGIIGGTGSGKSTLVGLIPRFYDVTSGAVEIGGRDVRRFEPDTVRTRIGYAAQHARLFRGTVRDNIKWGKPDADDGEILKAIDIAQLSDFVKEKKEGLSAPVEQGGRNLSGGQRQRMNVARAIVGNPEILILDDSSSALDRATDAAMRKALQNLDYSPTVFIVSQRVESLVGCDRIAVLDGGELVGVGTHRELYLSCEVYREICDSQKGGESL